MQSKLQAVRDVSGNDKLDVLRAHPELQQILKACYDPHVKYYMTLPFREKFDKYGSDICFPHTGDLTGTCKKLIERLHTRELSGDEAKREVKSYMEYLNEDHQDMFRGIINKDLRLDLGVRSINKVWPGLIPSIKGGGSEKPAIPLCNNLKPEKLVYPVLCSIKHDGVRGRCFNGKILSRSYKPINGMDHIEAELEKYPFDLDGELMIPGGQFDSTSGLVRNLEPVPEAILMVFDADLPGGKYERFLSLFSQLQGNSNTCPIKLIQQRTINNYEELMEYYHNMVEAGHEGIVICPRDGEYEDRRCWWRLVPLKSADCSVIGFEEGKGKLVGSLGKIVVDYKGHECRVGSGFKIIPWNELPKSKRQRMNGPAIQVYTRMVRDYIWTHQDEFMGKIAECQFKEETKDGSMRQPTFKCWRDDKDAPYFDI